MAGKRPVQGPLGAGLPAGGPGAPSPAHATPQGARKPDLRRLDESLCWLAYRGWLSGSWARGEQTAASDIDVRLAERHVQTLKRLLMAQPVRWDSPFLGSITW